MTTPHIASILAQIAAANARVAGMQAANQQRLAVGASVAYDEDEFVYEANVLERLAVEARNQS